MHPRVLKGCKTAFAAFLPAVDRVVLAGVRLLRGGVAGPARQVQPPSSQHQTTEGRLAEMQKELEADPQRGRAS